MSGTKIVAIIVFVAILIAIPAGLFFYSRSNPPESRLEGEVSDAEIRKVASETYTDGSIDKESLNIAKDIAIERKILDKLASENNITLSQDEIQRQLNLESATEIDAKYDLLKKRVIKLKVINWEMHSVRFWILPDKATQENGQTVYKPPDDEMTPEERRIRLRRLQDREKALSDAENLMQNSTALSAAQTIASKYPSLASLLAVNGNIVSNLSPNEPVPPEFTTPELLTQDNVSGDLYADTIRSMQTPAEIKKVLSDNNGGGAVFKLVSYNKNAQYATYEELLKEEAKKLNN